MDKSTVKDPYNGKNKTSDKFIEKKDAMKSMKEKKRHIAEKMSGKGSLVAPHLGEIEKLSSYQDDERNRK